MKKIFTITIFIILLGIIVIPNINGIKAETTTSTQEEEDFGLLPTCVKDGNCSIKEIVNLAINISKYLLGIVGSVALLFFIISGIMMIFSGGSEEKVTNARNMMVQTIIGLLIFLSAYLLVHFIQTTLIPEEPKELRAKFRIDK